MSTVHGLVVKNPSVSINGHDLSGYFNEIRVNKNVDDVDATGFDSDGVMQHLQGLRKDSFTGTFKTEFAANAVYFILNPLFEEGVEFPVVVAPTQSPVSTTNPAFEATCIMTGDFMPFGGKVGELATSPITLPCNTRITESYT